MSAQQAHHIIPVGVFKELRRDIALYERLTSVFGERDFNNLQQMGNNFIYLYTEQQYADRAAALLKENSAIFGDVPVGGVKHYGQ
ncbi:hypothetical protein [Conchiformibius kuhniae]|uniref:Uncharacterized protein n=1 Tax=Conchiformibius kuhniae TaxID=211502 RepID=A0A8T9MVC1_9NEIS|nr:hypothetical protein [Conchiformibius kuhniae]UOP04805.1 hypothetical protein LVJ77_11785 [Conchiformibius kuhniae]